MSISNSGKLYALILLHCVSHQLDSQLLENYNFDYCAFGSNGGLSDASYTMCSIMYKCNRY